MHELTLAALGGGLIGLATVIHTWSLWRVLWVSGIIKGLLSPKSEDIFWRIAFILGIILSSSVLMQVFPYLSPTPSDASFLYAIGSGILVATGVTLANGCTSGHAVCGTSRWSIRSIVATILFIISAMISVHIFH